MNRRLLSIPPAVLRRALAVGGATGWSGMDMWTARSAHRWWYRTGAAHISTPLLRRRRATLCVTHPRRSERRGRLI
jgi:hypothetical protein